MKYHVDVMWNLNHRPSSHRAESNTTIALYQWSSLLVSWWLQKVFSHVFLTNVKTSLWFGFNGQTCQAWDVVIDFRCYCCCSKFKSKRGWAVGSSLSSCACCRVIITETPIYTPAIWHCFLSLEVPKTARWAVAEELCVVVGIRKLPSARYCGTVLRSNLQAE